jgi:hypothetical protein
MLEPDHPYDLRTPFTAWLVRWRMVFFALVALLVIAPFNGEWRLGVDSALYRGVAENLAAGNGYTFAGLPQKQVYAGLPFLLAGLQKITGGNNVVPVLIVLNVMALLTLWATYQLIKLRYPLWIAVVVTCGVAMNVKFIQHAHEVMTDTPFLLGCVLAMLGWELLDGRTTLRGKTGATLLLIIGLFVAAMMRPTFWVLALAWVLTCVWNIVRRREKRSMIALGVIGIVCVLVAAIDPRVRGLNMLQGGYERELLELAQHFREQIAVNGPRLFRIEMPEALFNEKLWLFGVVMAVLMLVGAAMVTRRQPLWGLQVFILTAVMLLLSDVPRYYLMVLPTLWLGYVLVLVRILRSLSQRQIDFALFVMFSLANFPNLGGLGLIYEQHQPGPFIEHYHRGEYVRWKAMAEVIRKHVPPETCVVGPRANLLTYLSGRCVLSGRLMGFEINGVTKYPALVAAHKPAFVVGPLVDYRYSDDPVHRLLDKGVLRPQVLVDRVIDRPGTPEEMIMWLATLEVIAPAPDWRSFPSTRPVVQSNKPPRRAPRPMVSPEERERRELKARRERKRIRLERQERIDRRERNERRLRKQRRQSTQPTSQPASMPAATSEGYRVPLHDLGMLWTFTPQNNT